MQMPTENTRLSRMDVLQTHRANVCLHADGTFILYDNFGWGCFLKKKLTITAAVCTILNRARHLESLTDHPIQLHSQNTHSAPTHLRAADKHRTRENAKSGNPRAPVQRKPANNGAYLNKVRRLFEFLILIV